MKKSKIWIRICVHLLLFITLGVHSSKFDVNPVTDDISRLSILRSNIPKDYKIPVRYVPKEKGGMCWVKLNVFYLETSLYDLAQKFGNISSNRNDITIFIQMFQELRFNFGPNLSCRFELKVKRRILDESGGEPSCQIIKYRRTGFGHHPSGSLPKPTVKEPIMFDFQCHYRVERWQTARYFDFVKEFLIAAQDRDDSDDCDPPPCPTTPHTVTTEEYLKESSTSSSKGSECATGCTPHYEQSALTEVVERSLLSLLLIPLVALVFLLVWKVRSRRSEEDLERNPGEDGLFTGTDGTVPPLHPDISEKDKLNVIETV